MITGTPNEHRVTPSGDSPLFGCILVGVDGSEPGFEACRQAARLANPHSPIDLVAVVHLSEAARAYYGTAQIPDRLQASADRALEQAVRLVGEGARTTFVDGFATEALIDEAEAARATLLAIGTHGHRRTTEIMIGGVAGELLHRAPCSVLVARPPADADRFPRSVVVGIDGSACAEDALDAAAQLAARFEIPLRPIAATRSDDLDLNEVQRLWPAVELTEARPVKALAAASRETDLLVVGSRGLTGIRALGSVSERVAHQASCSVLVVRTPGSCRAAS